MNEYQRELDTLTKTAGFTSDTLQKLVDKATQKKPVLETVPGFTPDMASHLVCPACKQPIINVWSRHEYRPRYCHYCGQTLDWSDDR